MIVGKTVASMGRSPRQSGMNVSLTKGPPTVFSSSSDCDDESDDQACITPVRPSISVATTARHQQCVGTRGPETPEGKREHEAAKEPPRFRNCWEEERQREEAMQPTKTIPAAERLYNDHKMMQARMNDRRSRQQMLEQREIEEERLNAMPTKTCSSPGALPWRNGGSPEGTFSEAPVDPQEVTNRLYSDAVRRERKRVEKQLVHEELEQRACTPSVPPSPLSDGFGRNVHEDLYYDAKARRTRLQQKREDLDQKELSEIGAMLKVGRRRDGDREPDRVDALYRDAFDRQKRLEEKQSKKDSHEQMLISVLQAVTTPGVRPSIIDDPRSPRSVRSQVRAKEAQEMQAKRRQAREEVRRRQWITENNRPDQRATQASPVTSVDHAIVLTMAALSCRFACSAQETKHLRAPLQKVADIYRDALKSCEVSEGYTVLASRPSQRLFGNYLVCEFEGCTSNSEPVPLRQTLEDPQDLHAQAVEAQHLLKRLIAADATWDAGRSSKPENVSAALFAYDPGTKSEASAHAKALVQYGPSEGAKHYRHLTDLARLLLVFANCESLCEGLEQIFRRLEVVDVRNRFVSPELLGGRFMEVLVLVYTNTGEGEGGVPHLCELRLEELCFHKARTHATPHVEHFYNLLQDMNTPCADGVLVAQVARRILAKPLVSRHLRVFRCHAFKRYGSSVLCWRKTLGNSRLLNFQSFRRVCNALKCEGYCTELWEELDATRAGSISIFELDPETVALLVRFRARLFALAHVGSEDPVDADMVFKRCTSHLKLESPRSLLLKEFRSLAALLGFSNAEADRVYFAIGDRAGDCGTPPSTMSFGDFAWLIRLHAYVSVHHVALEGASKEVVDHNAPRRRGKKIGDCSPSWAVACQSTQRSPTLGKELTAQQPGFRAHVRSPKASRLSHGNAGGEEFPSTPVDPVGVARVGDCHGADDDLAGPPSSSASEETLSSVLGVTEADLFPCLDVAGPASAVRHPQRGQRADYAEDLEEEAVDSFLADVQGGRPGEAGGDAMLANQPPSLRTTEMLVVDLEEPAAGKAVWNDDETF